MAAGGEPLREDTTAHVAVVEVAVLDDDEGEEASSASSSLSSISSTNSDGGLNYSSSQDVEGQATGAVQGAEEAKGEEGFELL